MREMEKYELTKIKGLARIIGNELSALIYETREMITESSSPELASIYRRLISIAEAARHMETAA